MSLPKSVKIKKNGVEYISNVDRIKYTITELIRAALRDTGKYICNRTRQKIRRRTGRLAKNIQYWVRTKQATPNLQVGLKPGGFYGMFQEIGAPNRHIPRTAALTNSTQENVEEIRKIQAQYLSAVGTESAEKKIDEGEYIGE
ncbi:MAG: HK97 gp10 family phage protein [Ruminococcus sp.]